MGGAAVRTVNSKDVQETFTCASGPGGQHVNKVATCVQLIHRPTGVVIKCQEHRSQLLNRRQAWHLLEEALLKRELGIKAQARKAREKLRRQNRKPSRAAKEKILQQKKKRSLIKRGRKGASLDD